MAETEVLVMAVNLSRNGPALLEAYERVVNEKSSTDWWATRRAGSGPGAGRGRGATARGMLTAAHLRHTPRD